MEKETLESSLDDKTEGSDGSNQTPCPFTVTGLDLDLERTAKSV